MSDLGARPPSGSPDGSPVYPRVRNRLTVWIAVSAEDVAECVRDVIGVAAIVGADGITVTVRDNVVTLSGSVRSDEDRDAAVAPAARTPGVVGVRDEVRVVG
jgi:osmotically-inducible protein OsmY